jgi:hypothetical protein
MGLNWASLDKDDLCKLNVADNGRIGEANEIKSDKEHHRQKQRQDEIVTEFVI